MIIVASGIVAYKSPPLAAVVNFSPNAMKKGNMANMPRPIIAIPIISCLRNLVLRTCLMEKANRIRAIRLYLRKLSVAGSVWGTTILVKTNVVPPRQAEKLAKKIPVSVKRTDLEKNKAEKLS